MRIYYKAKGFERSSFTQITFISNFTSRSSIDRQGAVGCQRLSVEHSTFVERLYKLKEIQTYST